MLWLFLFHIDYTIYANHVLMSDLDTFGSDSIFVKNVFKWGKSSTVNY